MLNLPNILTLGRILLIPVFALAYLLPDRYYLLAACCFGLAALTDWLDGYLARRLGQTTRFGAFLDPVADKLIVVTALALLIGHHASVWMTIAGLIIICREIFISALREWMAELSRRGEVQVQMLGRIKTVAQVAAILVLLANPPLPLDGWVMLGYALLWIAVALTLWSMVMYLRAAWPALKEGGLDQGS